MPFLRDEGPPVSPQTIQRARETLPPEYGHELVNESGRETLLVRVPKPRPDYLHDLAEVAFYVTEDTIRNTKDILLVGDEKTARLEPQRLRDHIREQRREDERVVAETRKRLDRTYGQTVLQSPSNHQHHGLALRIPKGSVAEFSPDDVVALRHVLQTNAARLDGCQYGYIIADRDHERLGRRILDDLAGLRGDPATDGASAPAADEVEVADPALDTPAPTATSLTPEAALAALDAELGVEVDAAVLATPSLHDDADPSAPAARPIVAVAGNGADPSAPAARPVGTLLRNDADTYEIIGGRKAPAPPAPEPAASAAPLDAAPTEHEETYEIISRPRAPETVPAPEVVEADAETYEVVARAPTRAPAPAPAPAKPGRNDLHGRIAAAATRPEESYEIITRPARPAEPEPASAPARTEPVASTAPAAARSKEYEIISRTSGEAPARLPTSEAVSSNGRSVTVPVQAAAPAQPVHANGHRVAVAQPPAAPAPPPVPPEVALAASLREAGYELVEQVRVQDVTFAFAAHRPEGGRRLLAHRAASFDGTDAQRLAPLVEALGADACLVIADAVAPGARLATWGTRLVVMDPREAADARP